MSPHTNAAANPAPLADATANGSPNTLKTRLQSESFALDVLIQRLWGFDGVDGLARAGRSKDRIRCR